MFTPRLTIVSFGRCCKHAPGLIKSTSNAELQRVVSAQVERCMSNKAPVQMMGLGKGELFCFLYDVNLRTCATRVFIGQGRFYHKIYTKSITKNLGTHLGLTFRPLPSCVPKRLSFH